MGDFTRLSNYELNDEYYTPKSAWEKISHLIPNDKIIWESFLLNSVKSNSMKYLQDIGKNVIGDTSWDFFEVNPEYDIIVSNPPFDKTIKIPILTRLVELDKPFIIIMNVCNIFSNYFNEIFKDTRQQLQIIYPRGKLHFEKLLPNGTTELKKNTSFYCCYVCFRMNIPNDNLFLD